MKITLTNRELHVVHLSIIEHWRMPEFQQELSVEEFASLGRLRQKFAELDKSENNIDDQRVIEISDQDSSVLPKAVAIGMRLLDPVEFPMIVGEEFSFGEGVLQKINDQLATRAGSTSN